MDASAPLEEKLAKITPSQDTNLASFTLYCLSKLANVLFAQKLHRDENQHGIDVYMLHPGAFIQTGLGREMGFLGKMMNAIAAPFTKTLSQGAATTVYCAAHPDASGVSGKYWDSCWDDEKKLKKSLAHDEAFQEALWTKTEEIIANWEQTKTA